MPGRMIDLDGRGFGGVVSSIRAGDFRSRGYRMLSIRAVQAATEQETRDVLHFSFQYHWLDRIGYFEKVLTHIHFLTIRQPVLCNDQGQLHLY